MVRNSRGRNELHKHSKGYIGVIDHDAYKQELSDGRIMKCCIQGFEHKWDGTLVSELMSNAFTGIGRPVGQFSRQTSATSEAPHTEDRVEIRFELHPPR